MKKENMESLMILIFFYVFIVIAAIIVSIRFNELTSKGNIIDSNSINVIACP